MITLAIIGSGCAQTAGPQVVHLSSDQYQLAFDSALEAARENGMAAALRDRRGGVIETEARIAGSLIEPWRTDNASFDQAVENTIAFQRRRARFEFMPAGAYSGADDPRSTDDGAAADANQAARQDLTGHHGQLELRVWVFIERANSPGYRRGAWTRRTASRAALRSPEQQDPTATVWTPVARDTAYEQRLLAKVQAALAQ